ncbi:hypothetical protein ACFWZJ_14415 [Streptomyces massasporeus]
MTTPVAALSTTPAAARTLGSGWSGKRRTQVAAQNAAQAWMQLPPHEAGPLAADLVNMLLDVTTPGRTATVRAQIAKRLGQVTH